MVFTGDVLFRNWDQVFPRLGQDGLLLGHLPALGHLDLFGLGAACGLGVGEVVHGDSEEHVEQDVVTADEQENEVKADKRSETLQN